MPLEIHFMCTREHLFKKALHLPSLLGNHVCLHLFPIALFFHFLTHCVLAYI